MLADAFCDSVRAARTHPGVFLRSRGRLKRPSAISVVLHERRDAPVGSPLFFTNATTLLGALRRCPRTRAVSCNAISTCSIHTRSGPGIRASERRSAGTPRSSFRCGTIDFVCATGPYANASGYLRVESGSKNRKFPHTLARALAVVLDFCDSRFGVRFRFFRGCHKTGGSRRRPRAKSCAALSCAARPPEGRAISPGVRSASASRALVRRAFPTPCANG